MEAALTSQAVEDIFKDCLYRDEENTDDHIKIEGIVSNFDLHPGRVFGHKEEIVALLAELPESFRESIGGGHTFLNACNDKHDNQWTGEHRVMEQLFVLGIAIEHVKLCLPRDMWSSLPGGMPYYSVKG